MSNKTYQRLWETTQASVKDIIVNEDQAQLGRPEKNREIAFRSVAKLYIRYIVIYRGL